MRILIGVCGIGYGHIMRQTSLLGKLIARGHRPVVMTFGRGVEVFRELFPGVPVIDGPVPWLVSGNTGIEFGSSSGLEINRRISVASTFLAIHTAIEEVGGWPDLVISDYEPLSAQVAYAGGVALVTVDQQSKFLGYRFPSLNGWSRMEEHGRLGLFFPRAEMRISCSFYSIGVPPDEQYSVEVVPAIIRAEVRDLARRKRARNHGQSVVVYLSPYGPTRQRLTDILRVLATRKGVSFLLFAPSTAIGGASIVLPGNVTLRPFSTGEFIAALSDASCALCTAGHSLLSELMLLGIPPYCLPLATYDQHVCGSVINERGWGTSSEFLTVQALDQFLSRLEEYRSNLESRIGLMVDADGTDIVLARLSEEFGV